MSAKHAEITKLDADVSAMVVGLPAPNADTLAAYALAIYLTSSSSRSTYMAVNVPGVFDLLLQRTQ
ncbi:hypothetical protein NW764_016547 [Fusarium oxysporum]|nr:hypothetical protein NW764_016547 [Fusarium oxysporum]